MEQPQHLQTAPSIPRLRGRDPLLGGHQIHHWGVWGFTRCCSHPRSCFAETWQLEAAEGWSPAGHKGDGGTGSGKVRLLPEHKGAGGTCLTLTGVVERARTWKFWVSFSTKAEVFTQRAYFCTAETEMTRSLRMQMLRDLKQEQLKRSLPRKENLLLLHSYQSSTVPKEQDRKSFLWSGIRKCH